MALTPRQFFQSTANIIDFIELVWAEFLRKQQLGASSALVHQIAHGEVIERRVLPLVIDILDQILNLFLAGGRRALYWL